jgi:glyoxylase-like metal-dependent hydrolase (beta-lactamase superfamily II)
MTETNRRDVIVMSAAAASAAVMPGAAAAQGAAPAPTGQAPGFYRYRVGDMVVTAVHAGSLPRPLDGLVRDVPMEEVRRAAAAAFVADNFETPFTSLVVQSGGRTILLDTAFGDNGPPATAVWAANFRAAGFDPARVDQVIISHFHGDHIGGVRMREGALQFPNAEIAVPQAEWAFWMSDERMNAAPEAGRGGFQNARRVFAPIADRVRRFTEGEVAPGVTAVGAFGHTPGHTAFVLTSGNARLMFVADAMTHPAFFARNPDWSPSFDMDRATAIVTRRRLLDMAASERLQISNYHAPFPATGFVARSGNGYEFVPVQWTSNL